MEVQEPTLDVFFSDLEDPRIDRTKKYPLIEVVFLVICGTLCGADSWRQIIMVGENKLEWMKKFFPFSNGIPSHDTIGRVFSLIDPKKFQSCFLSWVKEVCRITNGEIIAIDGKKSCNSSDSHKGNPSLYLVNAWAVKNGISLGHVKVDDKSNEITAIPEILDLIDIKGAVVTIDSIGAQKVITKMIVEKEGDFVIGLKENQPTLHQEVQAFFETKRLDMLDDSTHYVKNIDSGHGRVETRECYHFPIDADWIPSIKNWEGINSAIAIVAERYEKSKDKSSFETRFYISSLSPAPQRAQEVVRGHWGIENNLHWTLDVSFGDDQSRIRKDHAPQNHSVIKKWVLGILKKDTVKKGVALKSKRLLAAMDTKYLESLVCQLK
jgi:predicted transposase YbfD/YdcC